MHGICSLRHFNPDANKFFGTQLGWTFYYSHWQACSAMSGAFVDSNSINFWKSPYER